ncbi:acetyl-CoA synthetase-like protein [Decorospora gaudefroyi]|uniref:Acetyl-CoA synthetase-like protein n=1 Tax=Decorospora gaudefroyi TaxID=184978 RepID=A0A6A5KRS3_9PLEO|nr:acetyl-CoA synthetase-like protein [Decorospora gaudefroyi]
MPTPSLTDTGHAATALPYALPAAAAGLAYLNGRHGFTYDWPLLYSLVSSTVSGALHARRDTLNLFYELESRAQSSHSNHDWVIFQGRSWTYAQAYDVVLRYGTWLKSKGVEKDEIVAMDFVNSDVFIWVWFGLWSIGAKPAFLNYNLTGKPLVHTVKTSTARLVLVDQEGRDKFGEDALKEHGFLRTDRADKVEYAFDMDQSDVSPSVRNQTTTPEVSEPLPAAQRHVEIIFFDDALTSHILTLAPTRLPNASRANQTPSDMAMLIYTSGTTGLPKPAVMAWGKCGIGAKFASSWMSLKNDIVYTSMPLYHSSASVLGVCAVLRSGSTISLSKKFSHTTFWPEIRASNATILHYVGETCRYLLSAPPSALDTQHKVRAAFGNGLRPDVWEPFKRRFGIKTIYEFYAATEAPGGLFNHSSNSFSAGAIARNGTLGSALLAHRLTLVRIDPSAAAPEPLRDASTGLCQICAYNEPGELLGKLDATNISEGYQGYYGNEKATQSKIIRNVRQKGDAYFRSGDLMRWDREGRFWFLDRIGDTFRWKAENVSTAEVAEALGRHDKVVEANVYGVQVPGHDGRAGCAAVVLRDAEPSTLASLAAHVRAQLPGFAVPIFLRCTQRMQRTGTNKQQKHGLQAEGIDPGVVEANGDVLFWLRDGVYVRFLKSDLERIKRGAVKL